MLHKFQAINSLEYKFLSFLGVFTIAKKNCSAVLDIFIASVLVV